MKLRYKVLLGTAAVAVASAASFPNEFGLSATTWRQREALSLCQQTNSTFISFLASDRENCYSRLRTVVGERTGLWSRHYRGERQMAQAGRQISER